MDTSNKKVSVTVSRNGDLINNVFLELTLTSSGATFYPAEAILSTVELEIGGQTIDKHYADWFRIYDELFRTGDEKAQHQALTDFVDGEATGTTKTFFVPKNDGLKSIPPQINELYLLENTVISSLKDKMLVNAL